MNKKEEVDYDVIVVGGGGAGMSAAIEAAKAGARVALCEGSQKLGGSTALSGGVFLAAGTRQQQELGVFDNSESLHKDLLQKNPELDVPIVRTFAEGALDSFNWLESLGVEFPRGRLSSPSGGGVPRAHEAEGFGACIAENLERELRRHEADIVLKNRVIGVVLDPTGCVGGVKIGSDVISCASVVITCGGYGGSESWIQRMLPKTKDNRDRIWYVGNEANRGDGLTIGAEIGAAITGVDSGLLLTSPCFYKTFEVIGPDWALLINEDAERFVREDGAYWEIAEALESQKHARGYYIFDQNMFETAKPHPRVLEALKVGAASCSYVPEVFQEQLRLGRITRVDNVDDLAMSLGVGREQLCATVESYNAAVRRGAGDIFGKMMGGMSCIVRPPFYAIEVVPAILVVTGGGLMIDAAARVLTNEKRVIGGLFAAGETTGNVFGRYYAGSGYAIASAITFGRIAGREAAIRAGSRALGR